MGVLGKQAVTFYDTNGEPVFGSSNGTQGKQAVTAYDTEGNYVDLSGGGGGEPSQYIKSIVEQENGLYTVTKQDNSTFDLFTETKTYEYTTTSSIPINTDKTPLALFTLPEAGNYKFDLFIEYTDSSAFNDVIIGVEEGPLGSEIPIAEANFPTIFDVGASNYSSVISLPVTGLNQVRIYMQLSAGAGSVTNVSATAKKVLTQ